MRVEPFTVGSVVHVLKRGARGLELTRDESDCWRFVRLLYLCNDEFQDVHANRHLTTSALFSRPEHWPPRQPLVGILAWVLMPNHFHLLLLEIREGGVSKFMQRLCGSMSMGFNTKYDEKGSIFQGPYKSITVDTDDYFQYLVPYIAVKNVFELYPGGLSCAMSEFSHAWNWAHEYPFSSLNTHSSSLQSPIVSHNHLQDLNLPHGTEFKSLAKDMLIGHATLREAITPLALEDW